MLQGAKPLLDDDATFESLHVIEIRLKHLSRITIWTPKHYSGGSNV